MPVLLIPSLIMPALVVSTTPRSIQEIGYTVERAAAADYIELRLEGDFIPPSIPSSQPIILKLNLQNIPRAVHLTPTYIDVPIETDPEEVKRLYPNSKILGSFHDFEGVPEDVEKLLNVKGFDALKIACQCSTTLEALKLLKLQQNAKNLTVVPMGEEVSQLRYLSAHLGAQFIYCSIDNKKSAPGQIAFEEALDQYRVKEAVSFYCLIGNPVAQSPSHIAHNRLFKEIQKECNYLKFNIAPFELEEAILLLDQFGCRGMSITVPHKQKLPASGGAAYNTRYKKDGSIKLANTDILALYDLLPTNLPPTNTSALIIGAGGTASAFAEALCKRGIDVTIVNRTRERALSLATQLGCHSCTFEELTSLREYDSIIHTTSADTLVDTVDFWDRVAFYPHQMVMDIQLKKNSPLLERAKLYGAGVIDGYQFWARQAAYQYECWFQMENVEELTLRLYEACQ